MSPNGSTASTRSSENGSTVLPPRTPSRGSVSAPPTASDTTPSTASAGKEVTAATFATDAEGDSIAPPQPFLAYARRVRSFASPLKLNKSRYLLTFADELAADEWWQLMQEIHPDSVRENPQLFSFKSDKVPVRAWDDPRFAHLRNRWTYTQVEGHQMLPPVKQQQQVVARSGSHTKRHSVARTLSTPTLRTIGERPTPDPKGRKDSLDDPFVLPPQSAPLPQQQNLDVGELNRTLDRIQMMMNQTNLRINALAERQQSYLENLERLQSAMENNANQIQALTAQHQAGAVTTRNMKTTIEQNATHVKAFVRKQEQTSEKVDLLQNMAQETAAQVAGVADRQMAAAEDVRRTKTVVERTAEQVQTLLDYQRMSVSKLDSVQLTMDQMGGQLKAKASKTSANESCAASSQKLQTAIEQQSAHLATIMTAQKTGARSAQKSQSTLDQMAVEQRDMCDRLDKLQTAEVEQRTFTKQQIDQQSTRIERQVANSELRLQTSNSQRQDSMMAMCQKILNTVEKSAAQQKVQPCTHDVIPPPRKMNRKLIGYVYSRTGE